MWSWLALAACDGGGAGNEAAIDTTALFPAEDGRYHAFRPDVAAAEDTAGDTAASSLENLLFLRWEEAQGCDGAAWRVELRTGPAWESGTPSGAVHFDNAGGLSICAYEEPKGDPVALDPAIPLWTAADLLDGSSLTAGAWTTQVARETEISTYYGTFPKAVSFAMAGGGGVLDGWTLHLAPDVGPILIETPDLTMDLVYFR